MQFEYLNSTENGCNYYIFSVSDLIENVFAFRQHKKKCYINNIQNLQLFLQFENLNTTEMDEFITWEWIYFLLIV